MSGVRLEVETNIIHGSSTAMKNLAKCVQQVGVDVTDMVYTALASSLAVMTDTEKELGTVLVDIGGGTTSLIAYVEGSPAYSSVLPIGAVHITHDLAIGLRTRLEEAEKIKLKLSEGKNAYMTLDQQKEEELLDVSEFGLDEEKIPKKFLYEVIDARLNEIFKLVALDLEKADLIGKLPAGIVITGGGALTAGIEKMAKRSLKMPARIGLPQGITGLIDEIQGPQFSASVGAVLYGQKALRTNADLSYSGSQGKISSVLSGISGKIKSFLP